MKVYSVEKRVSKLVTRTQKLVRRDSNLVNKTKEKFVHKPKKKEPKIFNNYARTIMTFQCRQPEIEEEQNVPFWQKFLDKIFDFLLG